MKREDIGEILDLFKNIDLWVKKSAIDLVFELLEIDDFDSDRLVYVYVGILVSSLRPW